MRFKGDIVKMPDDPTCGSVGTDGLFRVIIYSDDSPGSVTDWRKFETTAENVTYEEGLTIERNRLDELIGQHQS